MPAQFSGKRLQNTAAAAFFARKLNLPSNEWSDLWREAHDKAFTVAGTLNDSGEKALAQIREAVRAAIEDGETIEEFKKRFDDIVAKTGWDYRGGRNFRTRAIFETNLRTSWAAGRFAQMREIKAARPFWQYRHGGSAQPRPEHLAWDGLILHADHPWWRTHYPPNGFGCTCHVVTLDAEGVNRAWKKAGGQGNAPELSANSPGIVLARGQKGEKSKPRLWTPPDPEKDLVEVKVKGRGLVQVPRGIDPGWDYVPGSEAFEAQKREEIKKRQESEQRRRAFLAELKTALDAALAELKAIEAEAVAQIQKLDLTDAARRDALQGVQKLVAEAILDARKAHANAQKDAEKLEFNEADERRAELVATLRSIVERARRAAIDETRDTLQEAAQVLDAVRRGPKIQKPPPVTEQKWTELESRPPDEKAKPTKPMKRIADKHWKIGAPGSARNLSETNTLILPGVPWQREMQLVESGRAQFKMTENGIPTWEINGRVYGAHINKKGEKWVPYPRSGQGVVTVSKRVYKILEIIDASDSLETAFKQLQRRGVTSEEVSLAWRVWESLRRDSHDE